MIVCWQMICNSRANPQIGARFNEKPQKIDISRKIKKDRRSGGKVELMTLASWRNCVNQSNEKKSMGRIAGNIDVAKLLEMIRRLGLAAIFCILSPQPLVYAAQQRSDEGAAIELSLDKAIQTAIENNLTTSLARERQREARGMKRENLASLLPNLSFTSFQSNNTENLFAQGLVIPFIPDFIGPYRTFDARVYMSQALLDLSSVRSFQSAQVGERIAALRDGLAREQVATAAALAYVESLRSGEALQAAQANLRLAKELLKLAEDQRNAGVATGIDVARAATSVAQNTLALVQAQTASEQARLRLQRVTGLSMGRKIVLTDALRPAEGIAPSVEVAIAAAKQTRYELQIAAELAKQRSLERKAAVAEQYPSFGLIANYGSSGVTPSQFALPTRSLGVQINIPIFNGGFTRGRIAVARSQEYQAELQLRDTEAQVEEDVRLALVTLTAAVEQMRAADATLNLAERELRMARDRFAAGLADNIEVVNAQTSLENGRNGRVAALAVFNTARVNLAAALGRAQSVRF
jgi:outer membrane protein